MVPPGVLTVEVRAADRDTTQECHVLLVAPILSATAAAAHIDRNPKIARGDSRRTRTLRNRCCAAPPAQRCLPDRRQYAAAANEPFRPPRFMPLSTGIWIHLCARSRWRLPPGWQTVRGWLVRRRQTARWSACRWSQFCEDDEGTTAGTTRAGPAHISRAAQANLREGSTTSTRRFAWRPSDVSLLAIG